MNSILFGLLTGLLITGAIFWSVVIVRLAITFSDWLIPLFKKARRDNE